MSRSSTQSVLPRFIRLRDAPSYLGMDRNRFNTEVRPYVIEIPMGKQGIAFDRLDLDAWADDYKSRNGRPGQLKGHMTWDANTCLGFANVVESGTSTKSSEDAAFAKALGQVTSKKRKRI